MNKQLHFPERADRTASGAEDIEQQATNSDRPKHRLRAKRLAAKLDN
ncbi:MAG: hypothetical protein V7K47_22925 [Nostoc sp.]